LNLGKNLFVDAGDSITIKTGDAINSMEKNGDITIRGKNITIEGSGKINAKASSDMVLKGNRIAAN
jgi:type VI secretion system secreted protein VgrG